LTDAEPAFERRRIASLKAQDYADFQSRLQQGFAAGGMGFRGQFVRWQPISSADAAPSAKCGAPHEDLQNAQGKAGSTGSKLKSGVVLPNGGKYSKG
jgi:hypothetical protein